mmetsp:Transcript_20310/g.30146  ORF Transcript_20310/g.30146 Transcript_20310/m.30146 type:complete len:558 (+) Transcript_20310:55-1728(+)|eukprot:CAMPEP_0194208258 /NCGR_PEP_ID=MMETSP0156-20130528/6760_1 /TAXON_ID=33649 /ORGANISM="Thalassionema nitzschioides, Strain L26-B" /LENGTH=557 /DNA_ID=CAMNT_0038935189 /DNA_START=57 /DNA_END=1730 /DNA_ORIENTATION=+
MRKHGVSHRATEGSSSQANKENKIITARQESAPKSFDSSECSWYQISYSCRHTGRYVASSKRRIEWKFGCVYRSKAFSDEHEDHEVILVWSIKSGKVRLYWNNQDISRMFPETNNKKSPQSSLQFSWKTSRGVNFEATASLNANGLTGTYEFLIGDQPFSSLPSKELEMRRRFEMSQANNSPFPFSTTNFSENAKNDDRNESDGSTEYGESEYGESAFLGSRHDGDHLSEASKEVPPESGADSAGSGLYQSVESGAEDPQQQIRLATAGFSYQFDMEDELRSDMYTSTLDVLRDEVSRLVPEAEEMMSRAIINAFSEDHESETSNESALSFQGENPAELEAEVLGEVIQWLKWGIDFLSVDEMQDRKRKFMKTHVEQMVSHVRHDRLSSLECSKIMHRVATLLNIETTKDPEQDTVLLSNLNSLTTTDDLISVMLKYGDVNAAALSKTHEGIGFCRFSSPASSSSVIEEASNGNIEINGRKPEVFSLLNSPYSQALEVKLTESREKEHVEEVFNEIELYEDRHQNDPSEDTTQATFDARYYMMNGIQLPFDNTEMSC